MKLWKKITLALIALIALVVLGGFLVPSEFAVERSIVIDASKEQIYGPVNTLRRWPEWSVWTPENYPKMTYTYEGPESGVGAISKWTDPDNGNGQMEITESDVASGIRYTLQFEGFPTAYGQISFSDAGENQTEVSLRMTGNMGNDPISRYFGLLMDDMMGQDFEGCLAGMKKLVEESPPATVEPDPADEPASADGASEPTNVN